MGLNDVPFQYISGPFMYDNGRRLLANRHTCTRVIGHNDVLGQTSFRQQFYRTLIRWPLLKVTARTEIQTSVVLGALNTSCLYSFSCDITDYFDNIYRLFQINPRFFN